jgi:hypothetical protein
MKAPDYWKTHYVVGSRPEQIARSLKSTSFVSQAQSFELTFFESDKSAPNILISQGSGGHAFVFAELGYCLYQKGYNVFIMPKHGGFTINELALRHFDALRHISTSFNERIGIFSEGLGGFVAFYVALASGPLKSVICQNSPALLTEEEFKDAVIRSGQRATLPLLNFLSKVTPQLRVPISLYLNWKGLIDSNDPNRRVETQLVNGYLKDPDFDRWYPVAAVASLLSTPPPRPLSELTTPTMFMVSQRGFGGDPYVHYLKDLYDRLAVQKQWTMVDGSVYWMLSHSHEAAEIICDWFSRTL